MKACLVAEGVRVDDCRSQFAKEEKEEPKGVKMLRFLCNHRVGRISNQLRCWIDCELDLVFLIVFLLFLWNAGIRRWIFTGKVEPDSCVRLVPDSMLDRFTSDLCRVFVVCVFLVRLRGNSGHALF